MNVVDSSGWLEYFTLWTQDEHFEHIVGVQYIAKHAQGKHA